jgi:uncharacterized membrane protein
LRKNNKNMTKSEFLEIMSQKWDDLEKLQKQSSFYEYEKEFDELWVSSGRDVLEAGINKVIGDRRKKKKSKPVTAK